ncbi:uncharacterized protein LOC131214530 [Anopheles bellator]|uniref:uncharacterized protein LOC131214530 n=1 Tax=Anopheles bellator TaxID=139047 RepID=UPI0026474410|nr:uncharacterized protein LOC131214530 [Anopheles bellator]
MEMRNRTDQILYGPVEPRGNLFGDRQLEKIREVVKAQERTIAALKSSPRMLQFERQKNEEDAIKQDLADIECETAKVRQIYDEEEGKICSILVKIGINIGEEMLRMNELSNSNVDHNRHPEEQGLQQIHIGVLEPTIVESSPSVDDYEQLSEDGEDVSLALLSDTSQFSFGFDFKISSTLPKLRQIMKPICTYKTIFNKQENLLLKGNQKEYKPDNGQKRNAQSDKGPPFKRVSQMATNELQMNQPASKPESNVLTEIHDNLNKSNTTHTKSVTLVKPKTTNEKKDPSEGKESTTKIELQEAKADAKTRSALKRKSPTSDTLGFSNTKPNYASFAAVNTDSNPFLKPKSPTHQKKPQLQPQKLVKTLAQNKDHSKTKISKATSGCQARDAKEVDLPDQFCSLPESKENATKITDQNQASSPTSLGSPTSQQYNGRAVDEAPGSGPESSSNGSLDILLQYSNGEFDVNISEENLAPMSGDLDFLNDKFSRDEQNRPGGSGNGNKSTGASFGFDFDEQLSMDQDQDIF